MIKLNEWVIEGFQLNEILFTRSLALNESSTTSFLKTKGILTIFFRNGRDHTIHNRVVSSVSQSQVNNALSKPAKKYILKVARTYNYTFFFSVVSIDEYLPIQIFPAEIRR